MAMATEQQALAGARLIGVDWGSTSLRAFLISANGNGASVISGAAAFAGALDDVAGAWMRARPALPVVACGMVGSLHGWRDVPYTACPADARVCCPLAASRPIRWAATAPPAQPVSGWDPRCTSPA
ncbi:hypothetical protein GM668_10185 [Duganella ginsengisoli]|uniref:2-dehydro-3-deoxygalactonokinase n=1 Tax=Pseudoduganella ginsengisoli TaxID=1462440 RepID=A0A6L6PZL6_9BURK|nr:hypothetical protein [Pseudoduganella ginsengisoli]